MPRRELARRNAMTTRSRRSPVTPQPHANQPTPHGILGECSAPQRRRGSRCRPNRDGASRAPNFRPLHECEPGSDTPERANPPYSRTTAVRPMGRRSLRAAAAPFADRRRSVPLGQHVHEVVRHLVELLALGALDALRRLGFYPSSSLCRGGLEPDSAVWSRPGLREQSHGVSKVLRGQPQRAAALTVGLNAAPIVSLHVLESHGLT